MHLVLKLHHFSINCQDFVVMVFFWSNIKSWDKNTHTHSMFGQKNRNGVSSLEAGRSLVGGRISRSGCTAGKRCCCCLQPLPGELRKYEATALHLAAGPTSEALLAIFHVEHLLLQFRTKDVGKLEMEQARTAAIVHFPLIKHLNHRLQLDGVGGELADSVGQLLHGHAVFVVLPAESLLVHVDLLQVTGLGCSNQTNQQSSSVWCVNSESNFLLQCKAKNISLRWCCWPPPHLQSLSAA